MEGIVGVHESDLDERVPSNAGGEERDLNERSIEADVEHLPLRQS
jgi:hypothetical protein